MWSFVWCFAWSLVWCWVWCYDVHSSWGFTLKHSSWGFTLEKLHVWSVGLSSVLAQVCRTEALCARPLSISRRTSLHHGSLLRKNPSCLVLLRKRDASKCCANKDAAMLRGMPCRVLHLSSEKCLRNGDMPHVLHQACVTSGTRHEACVTQDTCLMSHITHHISHRTPSED